MSDHSVNLLSFVNLQDSATPEDLLAQSLPKILKELPNAHGIVVYRLAEGGLVPWKQSGIEDVEEYTTLEVESPYQKALVTGLIGHGESHQTIVAPLKGFNGRVFALLILYHSTDVEIAPLTPLIEQFQHLLYSKLVDHLFQIQLQTTNELNTASETEDIVRILAKNLSHPGQFVAFNLFLYDEDRNLLGARALATANRQRSFEPDEKIDVRLDYLNLIHDEIEQTGDMLISDTRTDNRLSKPDKEWLLSRNIQSLYGVALFVQDQLHGFITYIDSKSAQALTQEERQLFSSLARQAGSIIEKQNLLEQTEASLNATKQIYELVGDLMNTRNVPQILEALHRAIGHGTRNIAFSEYTYNDQNPDQLLDVRIRYYISDDKAHEVDLPWFEELQPEEAQNAFEFMQEIGDTLEVLEDYSLYVDQLKILGKLQKQGVHSSITIPLFEDGRRTKQVTLTWDKPQTFDQQFLQILRTAKSQIALVLQNQDLLDSVQKAAQVAQESANRLQQIAAFGQAMQTSLVLSEIIQSILEYSQKIIKADYVCVMTYDRAIDTLRQVGLFWDGQTQINDAGTLVEKGSNTIAGKVWSQKEMLIIQDLQSGWEDQHPLLSELHSILAAPLTSGGVVLGVLEAGSQSQYQYTEADILAFRQMSTQIATALTNAETYTQSQKLARNKGTANEIIAKLQRQADVDSILQVTARELGQALGAKQARIRLGLDTRKPTGE